MPLNCPQAVSKLKAYKQQHQDLQQQFSDFMSQFPYLPDIKTDEPFMQSPYYQALTDSPKEVFHNLYDAKQEAIKKLAELKELIEKYKEEEFSKLTFEQKIDAIFYRCFKLYKNTNEKHNNAKQEFKYTQSIPDLYPHEIKFLYNNINDCSYDKFDAIIDNRNIKKDLARAYNCRPEQIVTFQDEDAEKKALSKDVVYYYGDIDLNFLESAKGLELPQRIGGSLRIERLNSAEGLELPESIGGDLDLSGLTSEKGLKLPQIIGGSLYLDNLKSAEGLEFPKSIGESLCLDSIISAQGLKLPEVMGGSLSLSDITSAKGLRLPELIGKDVYLYGLTSVNDLELSKSIGGNVCFSLSMLSNIKEVELKYPHLADKIRYV